ncbi:hypothetical protein AEGHOMDF_4746 [Methylobacterium soli]|nr:hypothetical protein AEGHOMDF_4746 [Methylobacterium soli]
MRPPEKSGSSKSSTPKEGGLGNIDDLQGHPGSGSSPGPSTKGPGETEADKAKEARAEREKDK